MDIVWDDNPNFIDIAMILFTQGGEFSLKNEGLYLVKEDEEEEQEQEQPLVYGRSHLGKAPNLEQHRVMSSHLLYNDFWGPTPVYNKLYFKKFFKLPIGLFNEIAEGIALHSPYLMQTLGFSSLQKVCSAVCLLTAGVSSTEHDDKYCMATTTGTECMKRFCNGVNAIYGGKALRHPGLDNINRLLDEGEATGFQGCIGSIDCMHWQGKNCHSAWKGMFQGKKRVPNVILEAIADHSSRFWHFNFGSPRALNNINALDRSPLYTMRSVDKHQELISLTITINTRWRIGWLTASTLCMDVL